MRRNFEERKFVLMGIFVLISLVFIVRLFYIQVIDDSYKSSADNQALRYVTQYPVRGLIYDRNGELLVYNEAAYDLMVIPKRVKNIDTVSFCETIGITKEQFIEKIEKAKNYSYYKASAFEKLITADEYAAIAEKLYKFPGFYAQERIQRKYPSAIAAHLLGYIGEVNAKIIEQQPQYKSGDYIGLSGLEKSYEHILRGKPGVEVLVVDVHNRIKGSFQNGARDTLSVPGKDIYTSIDGKLQALGEKLMQNKKGSIVAIEPSTGEVLCIISSPGYDPNLLVGRERSKNYLQLVKNDSLKPLYNRALQAPYPPGSIFKMVQALIALEDSLIVDYTSFACIKSLVGCHNHGYCDGVTKGIQYSCNPYFYKVFKRIVQRGEERSFFKDSELGLAKWEKSVSKFGFGQRLKLDIPNVNKGFVPGVDYYDKIYGDNRWAFSTIYSLSIGQGELSVIPVQMANLAAIIANRGYYYTPHLVTEIGNQSNTEIDVKKNNTDISKGYFELVAEAMRRVVEEPGGTARRARMDSITVCGKTGTAENPHGEDHSVFIAFAPKDNPKIAISVYVENAGFGGTWAAPIASLMIEQSIHGEIKDTLKQQRILEADFIHPEKQLTQ